MISTTKLYQALDASSVAALADDDADGSPDSGVLEAALTAAEEVVRNEVSRAGYYPPETLPAVLEDIAVTLSIERLYERRREMLPGPWAERAKRARSLLQHIGEGKIPVDGLSRAPMVSSTPDAQYEPPLHRRSTLRGL